MTVQERMAFVSFSRQFSKRLMMMMKLCHSNSELKNEQFTNRATFQLPRNEYMNEPRSQLDKPWFHHFVSKAQAASICTISKDDDCIVLLDFIENYGYVVQHTAHAVISRRQKNADAKAVQSISRRRKWNSSRQFSKNCIFPNIQLKGVVNTWPPFKNLLIGSKVLSKKVLSIT